MQSVSLNPTPLSQAQTQGPKKLKLQALSPEVLIIIFNYAFDRLDPRDQLRACWTMKFFREQALLRTRQAEKQFKNHQQQLRKIPPGRQLAIATKKTTYLSELYDASLRFENLRTPPDYLEQGCRAVFEARLNCFLFRPTDIRDLFFSDRVTMNNKDARKAERFFKKELNSFPDSLTAKVGGLFIFLQINGSTFTSENVNYLENCCNDFTSKHGDFTKDIEWLRGDQILFLRLASQYINRNAEKHLRGRASLPQIKLYFENISWHLFYSLN